MCDEQYMRLALTEAAKAFDDGEVPVGALVVQAGTVVGRGYNRRERLQNPLGHAEMLAIEEAARNLGSWRLNDCSLYVTLEPCIMCVGAILQARMGRLVFGCVDPKAGAVQSLYRLCEDERLNHRLPAAGGVLARDCAALLENFFSRLRQRKRHIKNTERWPSPAEGA
ncbi:MAG TPA: tRNA adenosine(34) deaminase TadA [Candidatus Eisenbacteria bacterium]|nr:tRNA adenosine(34) deaminase TadA [Candidatus Eisenbacteria bacterium]